MTEQDVPVVEFGTLYMTRADCPNRDKCFSVVDQKILAHQLCAICTMLQEILKRLEK